MNRTKRPPPSASRRVAATLAVALLVGPAAWTASRGDDHPDDHHEAMRLRRAGEILPLQQILESFHARHRGRILEVELERHGGAYVYEIEFVTPRGKVREEAYDARTGAPLRPGPKH